MKIILFFIVDFLLVTIAYPQFNNGDIDKLNNLIPPSPEAANFARYVEIPVGNYTGTPNISVPIWNVKQGTIEVPITLSYHSMGVKVEEFAPWVGIGWALNAGGIVTRSVRGMPDDINLGTNFSKFSNQFSFDYLTGPLSGESDPRGNALGLLIQNCADAEPDVFYFNFGSYTGKIMYNWGGQPIVSCSKTVKVKDIRGHGHGPDEIIGWDITTGEGIIYKFRDLEQTNSLWNYGISCLGEMPIFNSSWLLTEISDINNENKIFFEYDNYILTINTNNSSSITYYSYPVQGSGNLQFNSARTTYYSKRIKRIKTSSSAETIEFIAGAERIDLSGLYQPGNPSDNNNLKALSQIHIKSSENLVKSFVFSLDYSVGRLTLKSIAEKSPSGDILPPQTFSYFLGELPALNSNSQDHWGFFNGAINQSLIPSYWRSFPTPTYNIGADRSINSVKSKIGLIKLIEYPTGGYVEFEYEQNDYGFVQNESLESKCFFNTSLNAISLYSEPKSSSAITKSFTINNLSCNGINKIVPTELKINYHGFNYDQFSTNKPKVELLRADGTILFSHEFGVIGGDQPEAGTVNMTLSSGSGDYVLKAYGFYPEPNNPSNVPGNYAGIKVEYSQPGIVKKNDLVGGMRIRTIKDFVNPNDPSPRTRTFEYKMLSDPTRSSGVIYQIPEYQYRGDKVFRREDVFFVGGSTCNPFDVSFETIMSANPNILGSTQGSHIGYREVKVTLSAGDKISGQSEFRFTSPYEFPDLIRTTPPFVPPVGKSFATGLLIEQSDFIYNGIERKILLKVENDYFIKNYEIKALKMGSSAVDNCFYNSRWKSFFLYGQYINNIGHTQLKSSKKTIYSDNNSSLFLTTKEEFEYDTNCQRLKKKTEETSLLKKNISEFYYVDEILNPSPLHELMINKYKIDPPIEIVKSIQYGSGDIKIAKANYYQFRVENGNFLRMDKLFYFNPSIPLPKTNFKFAVDNLMGQKNSLYDSKEDTHYQLYSSIGQLLQIKQKGLLISYLFGYKQQYPIAKILNKSYQDAITQSNINISVIDNPDSDASLLQELNKLYTLSNAIISSYTYKPLVGITSERLPNGRTTFYEYDSFNRLILIKDQFGSILKQYTYKYAK